MNNTAVKIVGYILKNNRPIMWLPKIIEAFFYQLFQRTTGSLLTKNLFNGKKIILFPKCNVSSLFIYSDIPDKKEIYWLRKAANKKTIFLDIGANIASYSIMMADRVGSVYAFEPYPLSFSRSKMNFLLNGIDEGRVVNRALSNRNAKVYFSNMENNLTENRIVKEKDNSIVVKAIKLDDWIKDEKFGKDDEYLVKIDVEGHEREVLEGGRYFFQNYKIKGVVFECFSNGQVFDFFEKNGYKVGKISENNYWARK